MGPGGDIIPMTDVLLKPKEMQKLYEPIPDADFPEVQKMSRAERRRWYRSKRR